MKKLMLLAMVFMLVLLPAIPANAEKPLYGVMDLEFNLGWSVPSSSIPEWVGTITIDDDPYGMAFFNSDSGKPFGDPFTGSVLFFGEIWVIYEWVDFDFDTQELSHGDVLLWGYDEGLVTLTNSTYRMNGRVEEASPPFEDREGRNVHMSGIIEWYTFGAPHFAPGTLRIN